MKKIDLGQAITILANVGVIAGLVFVGLQLRQDHLIARQQMSFAAADQSLYWAELTTSNSEVWFDGLSDEQLTPEDAESFDTLAEVWFIRMFTGFDGSSRLGVLGFEEIWVQQAALKLHQNAGLLRWWRSFVEQRTSDQAYGFVALVNQEMERLSSEER